ncbi:intermembrane lipid transfer protein VPS13A-like [Watersipora subatra]|uniref:intermembrane lipid transfer protein VPS13A-like n=1 Tax=Watersipora subatra TaxID=2589382 RepID=UPI00355B013C
MVFESLVADLLNKYLGDYVENLDKSQLNIGIWGGDVVLKNLELKASALDDLDLPVKVVSGHLGTLILKIPWKKLYTAPLEVVIEDLFAIAAPNAGQKYDQEKEEQAAMDKKNKQLNRVESLKLAEEANAKESDKKGDSFGEKLATQIVKNLQVKIRNIHIRYEDFYSTPSSPFSVGITLDSLSFQMDPVVEGTETVDEGGNPSVVKETVQKLFKV